MDISDLSHSFLSLYLAGKKTEALAALYTSPDSGTPCGETHRALFNFADALAFGNAYDLEECAAYLLKILNHPHKQVLALEHYVASLHSHSADSYRQIKDAGLIPPLPWLQALLAIRESRPLDEATLNAALSGQPPFCAESLRQQLRQHQRNLCFHQAQSKLVASWTDPNLNPNLIAQFPISYPAPEGLGEELNFDADGLPVVFLEPYATDWGPILAPLDGKPALFVFPSTIHLSHCLTQSGVLESLMQREHGVLIYSLYPNAQLLAQPQFNRITRPLVPLLIGTAQPVTQAIDVFMEALAPCLGQSLIDKKQDNREADQFYALGRALYHQLQWQRLGPERCQAVHRNVQLSNWFDPHKGRLGLPVPAPVRSEFLAEQLASLRKGTKRRAPATDRKLRIAHIVPQLIDRGNSPTRIIKAFLEAHDRERFDIYLMVTEVNTAKQADYPMGTRVARHSTETGKQSLEHLARLGVKLSIAGDLPTYAATAELTERYLRDQAIDIAIFHEADVVNLSVAQSCDVPCKAFFTHSEGLKYPGFDLYMCGDEDYARAYRELGLRARLEVIPFALDVRKQWPEKVPSKVELGLRPDSKLLVTCSNHLEHRLSADFCQAVSAILEKIPDSRLITIGKTEQPFESFRAERFPETLWARVHNIPGHKCPSHLMRAMDLYLNEFPEGGGFAVLDGMAAGLPVVTMYDSEGPQTRRVGGVFFGKERSVTSCRPQDYIHLACELLENPELHREWSRYSKARYASIVHVEQDVRQIEAACLDILKTAPSSHSREPEGIWTTEL